MDIIAAHIPDNSMATDSQALKLALDACIRNGITGFHDAGASQQMRTPEQMEAAHPALREFLAAKRAMDPAGVFRSDWYHHLDRASG